MCRAETPGIFEISDIEEGSLMNTLDMIRPYEQQMIADRRWLHEHPELSGQEQETKLRLMRFIKDTTGLDVVDKGKWFYAKYTAEAPTREPIVRWRSCANLFYSNWLNYYVYQTTPYDVKDIQ